MSQRVVLIGLDGLDYELIQEWVEEGSLPNINTILSEGAWADLETTPPPWTIPNWNVITTGKTPGTLGVYDFMSYDPTDQSYDPYFTKQGDGIPLWRYVNQSGGRTCVANLPSLHTPHDVDGISIVGWLPADDQLTYPAELQSKLDDLVDGYGLDVKSVDLEEGKVTSSYDGKAEFLDELYELTEDRITVFNYLLEHDDWALFMPVFTGTDRINHALWGQDEELLEYYQRIDDWVGTVLNNTDEQTTVGLVSDHGFSGHDKTFYINEWLEQNEFLTRVSKQNTSSNKISSTAVNYGRKYLPSNFKSMIPQPLRTNLLKSAEASFKNVEIDHEGTTAYCTSVSGTIYIDVDETDKEAVCRQLLESLETALNERGIGSTEFRIYRTEEVYHTCNGLAPDLILELDNVNISTNFRSKQGNYLISSPLKGNHHRTGILAFHGSDIVNKGHQLASVVDVAPTILYLLDSQIPTDMDGDVLDEFLVEDNVQESVEELLTNPLGEETGPSDADQQDIEDRLESLGYL